MNHIDLNEINFLIKIENGIEKSITYIYTNTFGIENLNNKINNSFIKNILNTSDFIKQFLDTYTRQLLTNKNSGITSSLWNQESILLLEEKDIKLYENLLEKINEFVGESNIYIVKLEKSEDINYKNQDLLDFLEIIRLKQNLEINIENNQIKTRKNKL